MTLFRPCIDLHEGKVKQIVGGSLGSEHLETNFVSPLGADHFAARYRDDGLEGGHIILLGQGNEAQAEAALAAYPGGLQLGGGVRPENAARWLDLGAAQVIATSYLFEGPELSMERVRALACLVGRERLVLDLSCRRVGGGYRVATNGWRDVTSTEITGDLLRSLAEHASEFLVHAADVEGKCEGIDEELVALLAEKSPIPVTYAGGARELADLDRVEAISGGRVDLTIGSALDIFGGQAIRYTDCVAFNDSRKKT
jgi:phosphoribosylformimino-5-aminoimidazole carboxamide ribotide isomerase